MIELEYYDQIFTFWYMLWQCFQGLFPLIGPIPISKHSVNYIDTVSSARVRRNTDTEYDINYQGYTFLSVQAHICVTVHAAF